MTTPGECPKGVVIDPTFDWGDSRQPDIPLDRSVIYEVHVKGFTRNCNSLIEPELRGTYAGVGHPVSIDYLQSLGITAVELLPVHAFLNDHHLVQQGLSNYWGYNTISFFCPGSRLQRQWRSGRPGVRVQIDGQVAA